MYQRAKMQWLKEGDSNTRFFHRSIKRRKFQQRILEIKDRNGEVQNDPGSINKAFEEFYMDLLGNAKSGRANIKQEIISLGAKITDEQANSLTREFTDSEIKQALLSIPGAKAPGPDGFNSTFYKEAWPHIGEDLCKAIRDFFTHGKMLKQINCTKLTLIPKVPNPQSVSEFRPIACCNTIYKVITKLICTRLKPLLPHIISSNQAGFIKGRQIFHNISIVQDLVGVYNRKATPPCCMLKVDIRKAYDSVDWEFLQEMLAALNFPQQFIGWVMACVTTASYSLCVNGSLQGFFQGKRGLRQGDPMSPLLFVICMEYLTRLMKYVSMQKDYQFHHRCKKLALNHLVFADDLIIFCKGDYDSVMWNMRSLATFAATSGLNANAGKSAIYTCNMPEDIKQRILQETKYTEDSLPFTYLGVKISAKRLGKDECQFLIAKIGAKLRTWGSRTLSYAGRTQLVNSVLLNLHTYWASIFVLPKKVIEGVVSACRSFLWDGKLVSNKSPLIAWDIICRDKKMGGLGFKESHTWNYALMGKYIWSIASKEDNLWVMWIDHVYLKGKDWKSMCLTPQ
ncbi:LINE-1 retrotransposable element ORF2 protein [Bienertia sinuspersici]